MSTYCENLLKRSLVLNPSKRGTLEVSQDTRPHRPLHFYHTTPYLSLTHTHTHTPHTHTETHTTHTQTHTHTHTHTHSQQTPPHHTHTHTHTHSHYRHHSISPRL